MNKKILTRGALVVLALVTTLMPIGRAAAEHCTQRTRLLSGTGFVVDWGFAGCATEEESVNTDLIVPGSSSLLVRWDDVGMPEGTATIEFSGIVRQVANGCDAGRCTLRWEQGTNAAGQPGNFWDSQVIGITRASSATGGAATITICSDPGGSDCETRVYRTIAG